MFIGIVANLLAADIVVDQPCLLEFWAVVMDESRNVLVLVDWCSRAVSFCLPKSVQSFIERDEGFRRGSGACVVTPVNGSDSPS